MKNTITIEDTPGGIQVSVDYRPNQAPTEKPTEHGTEVSRFGGTPAEMLLAYVMAYIHSPGRLTDGLIVLPEIRIPT